MITNTTPATWRRFTVTVLGAGAIAISGLGLLAPTAFAQPQSEAQTECSDPEAGGDYSSGTDSAGNTVESCCFESLSGITHCDVWVNGKWDKDRSFREEPTAPPVTPGAPPIAGTPQLSPDVRDAPKNTVPGGSPAPVTTVGRR